MKNRKTVCFFLFIFLLLLLSLPFDSVKADEITLDRTTGGSWVGNYGSDGYYLVGEAATLTYKRLPQDVKLKITNLQGDRLSSWWSFWNELTDYYTPVNAAAALLTDEKEDAYRCAVCQYDGTGIAFHFSLGEETRRISFYMVDFDAGGRLSELILYDEEGKELTAMLIGDMTNGVYASLNLTGNCTVELHNFIGPNAVYSGVFFDKADGEALNKKKEETEPEPYTETETETNTETYTETDTETNTETYTETDTETDTETYTETEPAETGTEEPETEGKRLFSQKITTLDTIIFIFAVVLILLFAVIFVAAKEDN